MRIPTAQVHRLRFEQHLSQRMQRWLAGDRVEIPQPVVWPGTPICPSRKRASKPCWAGRLWDGVVAVGQSLQLGAGPGCAAGERRDRAALRRRWDTLLRCLRSRPLLRGQAALGAAVNQPRSPDSSFILLGPIKNSPCAEGRPRWPARLFPCGAGGQGRAALPAPQPLCWSLCCHSPSDSRHVAPPRPAGHPRPPPLPGSLSRLSCFQKKPARGCGALPVPGRCPRRHRGAPSLLPHHPHPFSGLREGDGAEPEPSPIGNK